MKEIIKSLKNQLKTMLPEDMGFASWGYEEGVILTGNEARRIIKFIEEEKQQ